MTCHGAHQDEFTSFETTSGSLCSADTASPTCVTNRVPAVPGRGGLYDYAASHEWTRAHQCETTWTLDLRAAGADRQERALDTKRPPAIAVLREQRTDPCEIQIAGHRIAQHVLHPNLPESDSSTTVVIRPASGSAALGVFDLCR